ncbi:hypothetical protein BJB45_02080 [Halomonas huangheensis]|uniref:DUF306 domain-containing protein n=2 Tax=Halomonas huangheensis TaxID=1178482 RepID=W1N4T3_9GAMM|nr:hypothetical protein AR456_03590 [Halomonas huangheensis]ERL49935.1 hypothetical protein BJB45_02080 [Halomonas huangheensis]
MIRLAGLAVVLPLLAGCMPGSSEGDDSALGQLPASFRGHFPCEDCKEIREELALFDDGALLLKRVYLGPGETRRDVIRGSWQSRHARQLSLLNEHGEEVARWQLADNGDLVMNSSAQDKDESRLARLPQYVGEPLEDRYWRVLEIDGQPVDVSDAFTREPHLVLHSSELRIAGSNGCNPLMGSYRLSDGQHIDFEQMASTRGACAPDVMAVAEAFEKVLLATASWRILADHLELHNDAGEVLASFEVVHL